MTNQPDNYEDALEQIRKLVVKLHGGYTSIPDSERDVKLGFELWDLYVKNLGDVFCTEGKE